MPKGKFKIQLFVDCPRCGLGVTVLHADSTKEIHCPDPYCQTVYTLDDICRVSKMIVSGDHGPVHFKEYQNA